MHVGELVLQVPGYLPGWFVGDALSGPVPTGCTVPDLGWGDVGDPWQRLVIGSDVRGWCGLRGVQVGN